MTKNVVLLKAVSIYLIYFLYTYYASYFVELFPSVNSSLIMFALDMIFMIIITSFYWTNIKTDIQKMKEKQSWKKIFKLVVLGVLGLLVLNIVMGAISSLFFPDSASYADSNTQAIQGLANLSMIYTVFKTMIFSVIAEELLFRKTLSDYIDNNIIFVLVTALIYTVMNFIFTVQESSSYFLVEFAIYFLPALLLSYIYVKNDRNVILIMLIKLIYNLIPLTILLLGI